MLSMESLVVRPPSTVGMKPSPPFHPLRRRHGARIPARRRRQFLDLHARVPYSPVVAVAQNGALASQSNAIYTVGEFMTKKEDLHVVKPTTSVNEALEMLVENRITGFPVIDDDWNLVGVVSDYDLLALDSVSGSGWTDTSMFPEVDSTWKAFNKVQKLLSKTNGKLIGEVMTPAPVVIRETTNLEDAARILLETKYRRLPVVDGAGKLVGILTRGNVVRAALQIKHATEKGSKD